jgi:hypothetical protein
MGRNENFWNFWNLWLPDVSFFVSDWLCCVAPPAGNQNYVVIAGRLPGQARRALTFLPTQVEQRVIMSIEV